jgi:hypothetical protein
VRRQGDVGRRTAAKAASEQAAAKVQQLGVLLAKKTVRARLPRCRVGIRSVRPGQYLGENTRIADLQGHRRHGVLDFAIPQDQAWRVKPGMVFPAIPPRWARERCHCRCKPSTPPSTWPPATFVSAR